MSSTASLSNAKMSDKPAKKSVKKEVAAPAEEKKVVVAEAPEKKRAGRKPAKEEAKPVAKTEVVVPVVEKVEEKTPASFSSVAERLREVQSRVTSELREIVREALLAAKTATREVKDARKKRRVKKDPSEMTAEEKTAWEARRANNAFLKPRPLTPELCTFMGVAAGSQRSQTEVTKFVSTYVKSHSCFDPANKRRIIPDGALSKLLRVKDTDVVTYLNLQSFLKAHFVKPTA